jgi:hypothetical protein
VEGTRREENSDSIIHDPLLVGVTRSWKPDNLFHFVSNTILAIEISRYAHLHLWQQSKALLLCWNIEHTGKGIIFLVHFLADSLILDGTGCIQKLSVHKVISYLARCLFNLVKCILFLESVHQHRPWPPLVRFELQDTIIQCSFWSPFSCSWDKMAAPHILSTWLGCNLTSMLLLAKQLEDHGFPSGPSAENGTMRFSHAKITLRSSMQFLQIPWDPGGTMHRLEGKPHFKKGGMLGTTLIGISFG